MTKERKAALQMLTCAILWSISGILIKLIPWHAMVITSLRALIAAVVVFGYIKNQKLGFMFNKQTVLVALCITFTCTLFISANKLTTAANAIVLQYTAPIFLLLYCAIFRKQRFRAVDYLVVLLTIGGIALFFFDQLGEGNLLGNIIAIGSGMGFASMMLSSSNVDFATRLNGILQGQLLTTLIGLPFCFIYDMEISVVPVLSILALGVVQLGIPYILYGNSLKYCSPLTCSLLSAAEPLLNPVWVFIFIGEAPGMWALIGGAVVIVAITGWYVWNERWLAHNKAKDQALAE